ncbi:MAG: methyltransferase domain-containing protein [Methylotenera sp.]
MKSALNLGCGKDVKKSSDTIHWKNVDICQNEGVDAIFDLDVYPWPLDDNQFDHVLCNDVLEHLDNVIKAMEEIYRISKPSATVEISVPYYASKAAFTDITHKRFFTENSMDYFSDAGKYSKYNFYTKVRFRVDLVKLSTVGPRKYLPFKTLLKTFFLNIVDNIEFYLTVEKA